mgnify:FL=1
MPPIPENSTPAKTFLELQALGVRNVFGYLENLNDILDKTVVTQAPNNLLVENLTLNDGINFLIVNFLNSAPLKGQRLIVVGNGGSAAIAIHTLADYANAGGLKTVDLFNPSLLTCMANDYGYENVFSKPIEMLAEQGDILFAISSSGKSPNILNACESALAKKCQVVTFSGFSPDNPLRKSGHLNFYVPSTHYGFVELSHQILIHCVLDLFVRANVYEEARELLG